MMDVLYQCEDRMYLCYTLVAFCLVCIAVGLFRTPLMTLLNMADIAMELQYDLWLGTVSFSNDQPFVSCAAFSAQLQRRASGWLALVWLCVQ